MSRVETSNIPITPHDIVMPKAGKRARTSTKNLGIYAIPKKSRTSLQVTSPGPVTEPETEVSQAEEGR